jgi:hypothetical protein
VSKEAGGNHIQWDPESGQTAREDTWFKITVTNSPTPVSYMTIQWLDGSSTVTKQCYRARNLSRIIMHTYLATPPPSYIIPNLFVRTFDSSDTLIEILNSGYDPERSSYYRVNQYRIERYKGSLGYSDGKGSWFPDWTPFEYTDGYKMDFYDTVANPNWNYGYRLWLRYKDDQDEPRLHMIPSNWVETGSGEGS